MRGGLPRLLDFESISTTWDIRDGDGKGIAGGARAEYGNGDEVGIAGRIAFEEDFRVRAIAVPRQGELLAGGDAVIGGVSKLDGGGEEGH